MKNVSKLIHEAPHPTLSGKVTYDSIDFLRSLVSAFDGRHEYLNTDKSIEQLVDEYTAYLNGECDLDGETFEDRFSNAQYELENQGRLDQDDVSMVAVKISSSDLSTQGKIQAIEGLLKVQQLWSRRCRVTGQGFDEGFLLFDTDYVKEESDAVAVLRDYYLSGGDVAVAKRYKADAVLEKAYEDEVSVYTEWEFSDEVAEGNFYLELSNGSLKSWDEYLESFN